MVLEADPPLFVAEREKQVIVVEVLRAEQRRRLADEPGVLGDLFVGGGEQVGAVGDDVERHRPARRVERHAPQVAPGEDRRIDERLERHDAVADLARRGAGDGAQCRRRSPPVGEADGCLKRNVAGEEARRVERHLIEFEVEHRRGDDDPTLIRCGRRDELEVEVDCRRPGGHVEVEGVDVDRIARPFDPLAAGVDDEAGELVDRPARRMLARQPLRIEQGQRPRPRDGDRLVDGEDAPLKIGRVDVKRDRARVWPVDRRDRRRRVGHRLRQRWRRLGGGGGRDEQGEREADHRRLSRSQMVRIILTHTRTHLAAARRAAAWIPVSARLTSRVQQPISSSPPTPAPGTPWPAGTRRPSGPARGSCGRRSPDRPCCRRW